MESLIYLQEDVSNRLSKAQINFKKSPKDRLNKSFIETRLQSLEQLWKQFVDNHRELLKTSKPNELKSSSYIEKDVYGETEEVYVEFKCKVMDALSNLSKCVEEPEHFSECNPGKKGSNAKLPKIIIPKFSGKYSEWSAFRDLFLSLVHNSDMESIQKMQYLKGLLTGEAEQLVRHINLTADNYKRCWDMLEARYNNKRYLCNTILKRLLEQPSASTESANFIKELLDTTSECLGALTSLEVDVSTWDIIIVYITSLRLDHETRKQWELQSANSTDLPTWKSFEDFLINRFRALEFVDSGSKLNKSKHQHLTKSFHVSDESKSNVSCKFCKEPHKLAHCTKFVNAKVQTRREFVEKHNNICFNCLGDNHRVHQCLSVSTCRVCQRRHHTYLHLTNKDAKEHQTEKRSSIPEKVSEKTAAAPVVCFAKGGMVGPSQVLLATALVRAESNNGDTRIIRALLDQGSQASFITEATAQYLGLKRTPIRGVISGLEGSTNVSSSSMVNITIKSIYNQNESLNLNVYVLKSITTLLPSKEVVMADWVLGNIPLADPKYNVPNKIDMLLGAAVYGQVVREGVKKNPGGTLLAQNTTLGWILSGMVSNQRNTECNMISMHTCVEDIQLKRFWELEADPKAITKPILTEEESQCEKLFAETTTRDQEGRYIVKLPFKTETPDLKVVDSKRIAEKRLNFLLAKLNKAKEMKVKYIEVIEEYLQLEHMEQIPEKEINKSNGAYLPHFAVIRNDKDTTKVRIVFDAACKGENGISLNDMLMVGPTLQPELRHLLMNWRQHRIGLSADIVKMYRQVKVATEDVDFQRILWKEDQLETKTKELRLLRITFGTASAPYLAVKALQQVAHDEGARYPAASEKVITDFYMDDLLTGCEDVETAMQIYKEMNELLLKGGFKLQKWSSNCEELLEQIRENGECVDNEEGLKLKVDDVMKLLGLTWNRKNDAFQYMVTLPQVNEPITKRKIISDIAKLFDPLGWVAPSVIIAKALIQKLWISGAGWDETVPSKILEEWIAYRNDLPNLSSLQIPRWIQTSRRNSLVELHGFADASKIAYAAVVYIRVVDEHGDIHVNLVTAKTKVAPIKQISIPRLELCGAVLVTRLLVEVAEVMKISRDRIYAWTDSTVVLAWLNSHPNRWQTFVANRVSEILSTIDGQQWSHIRSKQNPADCASRGMKPTELINNNLWLKGPEVLHATEVIYNRLKSEETNLEEIKVHLVTKQETIWERFSNLNRLIRVIAYCRRFLTWKTRKVNKEKGFLTTQEIREAMDVCIRECQRNHFNEERKALEENNTNEKLAKLKGPLKSLNPYIDSNKLLRVGGRLERSSLSEDEKHPILIPRKSKLTELMVADAHAKTLHGGPQLMLTYLRSKFWVLGAKDLVKAYVRKCVKCTRYSAVTSTQMMGQLPPARVTPTRPFKSSGVDYAGPINIRTSKGRGHHATKGYICLFVCMVTKAIHVEVVSDLTTQGFLAAFKRFVSRRGQCTDIWSDNGTNFVGASKELEQLFSVEKSTLPNEIAQSLASNGTHWHFIPPLSPNFGGLWEAGVKSVKYHLKRVIGETTLTYEELSTVLGQIEACLNSRPLSRVDTESEGFDALTPGHFLVGEPLLTVPDYNFESSNISSLRRWQLTQRMMQTFWRRWSQEYLSTLVHRYKWSAQTPEPNIGDLVLIKETDLPPSRWLLGRVVIKHTGEDNLTRVVSLRTKNNSILKRPTSKLCLLPVN